MRTLVYLILALLAGSAAAQEYRLPFDGRWFILQGGDTLNVNAHMAVQGQWYGVDFGKVGGSSERELIRTLGTRMEDLFSWGAPVLAPVNGVVLAAVDEYADNPLGTKDPSHPLGNYIVIKATDAQYVFLAHLQRGSIAVKAGDHLSSGQPLGKCGNSGNSDFPHIHMHVQDSASFGEGRGQTIVFRNINIELSGKVFAGADWPLIRGLFVWNH
jgi:hypothetical protein